MTPEKLQGRSKRELREMARKRGIAGWHGMRKEELVEALAQLSTVGRRSKHASRNGSANGHGSRRPRVAVRTRRRSWPAMELALVGDHQAANAAVAVACVEELIAQGLDVGDKAVATGLAEAAKLPDVKVFHAGTKLENGLVVTDVPLGIIPLGTTNVLAKELAIPLDIEGACSLIAGPHRTAVIDAMKLGEGYYYTQIGVAVEVADRRSLFADRGRGVVGRRSRARSRERRDGRAQSERAHDCQASDAHR